VKSAKAQEDEIERLRPLFVSNQTAAGLLFESVEQSIQSFAYEPLMTARIDKRFMIESQASIMTLSSTVDHAWTKVAAMRSFLMEDIDSLRNWKVR
jgi:hypothetical protein